MLFLDFLFLLVAICILYFAGSFVFYFLFENFSAAGFFQGFFFRIFTGTLLFMLGFSFVFSKLQTVNLGFLLIVICFLIELKREQQITIHAIAAEKKRSFGNFFLLIFSILFVYVWSVAIIFKKGEFGFSPTSIDNVYYATLSENLRLTGEENPFGIANLFSADYHGTIPYHYFELWLNSMFSRITHQKDIVSFQTLTFPLLNLISVIGLFAICEIISKFSWKWFLVPLFLFVGAFYFNHNNPNYDYTFNFIESPMEYYGEKFSAYYPFIILSFLFFLSGYFSVGIVFLLTLPKIGRASCRERV